MAVKFYHVQEFPDKEGFAIRADTEIYMKKTLENFSSESCFFEKLREDEKYAHFTLIEEDYYVLRDKTADATTIGAKSNKIK